MRREVGEVGGVQREEVGGVQREVGKGVQRVDGDGGRRVRNVRRVKGVLFVVGGRGRAWGVWCARST